MDDTSQPQSIARDERAHPARLSAVPGCGANGWWCHTSCFRHGACQYVRRAVPESAFTDEPTEAAPRPRTLDDILTEHCRRTA